eukprot:scaffold12.g8140.t1
MVLLSAAAPPAAAEADAGTATCSVEFSNSEDVQCTVITLSGRTDTALLMQVTGVFTANDVAVSSASINSGSEGALAEGRWGPIREQLLAVLNGSLRSSKPMIFGIPESGADASALAARAGGRSEASALLERKMAAMEAVLTARRKSIELAVAEPEVKVPDFFQPPPVKTTGPAAGSGYEIILQARRRFARSSLEFVVESFEFFSTAFNWESCKEAWYRKLTAKAADIAAEGFTAVWLPPPTDSVSPQGYLPRDLYDLNSRYGTEAELRECISALHEQGLKVIADIVINHRCAHYQGDDGKWNKFGGRLAWDKSVICANNPAFGGSGGWKDTGEAPRRGFVSLSGACARARPGYEGRFVGEYIDATVPEMAFGEFWDTCSYTGERIFFLKLKFVSSCCLGVVFVAAAAIAALDFTTKGILQEAVGRREYWRLIDSQGRPPGVMGLWPSRAITFLENHDTGSTLNHWPFPWNHLGEGYAYLLTHPGTPCVFWDHLIDPGLRQQILELVQIRRRFGINYKSEVAIRKAYGDLYAVTVDKKIAMKIGPASWSPTSDKVDVGQKEWKLLASGPNWAVWQAIF